jgi:rhodanese-related sulfurtransferase
VAQILTNKGYPRVFALRGGFDAWVASSYPLEEKANAA